MSGDYDPFEQIAQDISATLDRLERQRRGREDERRRARFYSDGTLRKRPMTRNMFVAEAAFIIEPLAPHAELWITYTPRRDEALRIRADEKLREALPIVAKFMDPDALNGYVAFDKRHAPRVPAGDKNLVQYIPVHGGITYAAKDHLAAVWGFDTMHYLSENQPRTDPDWIRANCHVLYRGLLLCEMRWKEFRRAKRERKMEIVQEILDLVPEQSIKDMGTMALLNTLMGKIG